MFLPKILIIENQNNLTPLTVNTIEKNCSDFEYQIIQYENGYVPSVLNYAKKNGQGVFFVVKSGVALFLDSSKLPPENLLKKNHMVIDKVSVYNSNSLYSEYYDLEKTEIKTNVLDLSVFIINTEKFDFEVTSDSGFINKISVKTLPLAYNHRGDPLMSKVVGPRHLFKHAVKGEKSFVLNYIKYILSGEASIAETWALCFDKLMPYTEGLDEKYRKNILKLGTLTKKRISEMRKLYAKI